MIITALNWLFFSMTFWILGAGFFAAWQRGKTEPLHMPESDTILVGFCLSLLFALWTSLFLPLGITSQIVYILIVVGVLLALFCKKKLVLPRLQRPNSWLTLVLIALVFLLIFINSLNRPTNPDSGIYHAQTIRWIESYPVVPGLANLHTRLGFNSSWLVVNALFSFHQIFPQSLHCLPGFLFVVVCAALLQKGAAAYRQGKIVPALFGLLAVAFLLETNIGQASSPGTDLPAILLMVLLTFLWINQEWEAAQNALGGIVMVFLTFTVITIKLSAAPIALLTLIVLFRFLRQKQRQALRWFFLLAGLVFIPWCARSVMLTGYLVYPIPFPDLFSVDWKIPAEHLRIEQAVIRAWGRMPGLPFEQVNRLAFLAWAKPWFYDFSFNRRILVALAFLSPVAFLPLAFRAVRAVVSRAAIKPLLFGGLFLYAGIVYWVLSAPDIRFGYTFIIPLVSLMVSLVLIVPLAVLKKPAMLYHAVLMVSVLFTAQILVRSVNPVIIRQQVVSPADYPNLPTYPCEIYNKTILCAELYHECWYAPFPCIPTPKPQAVMRGEDFGSGFRLKQ